MDDGTTRDDPPRDEERGPLRAGDAEPPTGDPPGEEGGEPPTDDESSDGGGWFTHDVDDLPPDTLEPGTPSLENAAFVLLGVATALAVWLLLLP